jgi:hypothetical protein
VTKYVPSKSIRVSQGAARVTRSVKAYPPSLSPRSLSMGPSCHPGELLGPGLLIGEATVLGSVSWDASPRMETARTSTEEIARFEAEYSPELPGCQHRAWPRKVPTLARDGECDEDEL